MHDEILLQYPDDAKSVAKVNSHSYSHESVIINRATRAMRTIKFNISESEGYYVADAEGYSIVTQAKSWDKLMQRIDDAVRLYFKLDLSDDYKLELDISSQALSTVKKGAKA